MKIEVNQLCDHDTCKTIANMQLNHPSRVNVDSNAKYVKVYMKPDDNEAVKPNNIKNRRDAGRQRNEIRFKHPEMCLAPTESGEWTLQVRIDVHPGYTVDGPAFYHLVQIKSPDVSRPIFTLGIKKKCLAVYFCDGIHPSNACLAPLDHYIHKWINVSVKIDRAKKMVGYTVDSYKSSYNTTAVPVKEMYLKVGQYRSFPHGATKTVSSSYKAIELVKD